MPSLCVYCGSSPGTDARYADAARQVGVSAKALGNTLAACRNGLELAKLAVESPDQVCSTLRHAQETMLR